MLSTDAMGVHYQQVQRGSKPGTVGMPLPSTSFKTIDPESSAGLPTGEAGMILISHAGLPQRPPSAKGD